MRRDRRIKNPDTHSERIANPLERHMQPAWVFGQIRTMTGEKGEALFVGKDVERALGYKKTENALLRTSTMRTKPPP
jgi:prophage antirepressor-like protein